MQLVSSTQHEPEGVIYLLWDGLHPLLQDIRPIVQTGTPEYILCHQRRPKKHALFSPSNEPGNVASTQEIGLRSLAFHLLTYKLAYVVAVQVLHPQLLAILQTLNELHFRATRDTNLDCFELLDPEQQIYQLIAISDELIEPINKNTKSCLSR